MVKLQQRMLNGISKYPPLPPLCATVYPQGLLGKMMLRVSRMSIKRPISFKDYKLGAQEAFMEMPTTFKGAIFIGFRENQFFTY